MKYTALIRKVIYFCGVLTLVEACVYLYANAGDIMVAEWLGEVWCLLVCSIIFIILGLLLVILYLAEKYSHVEALYKSRILLTQTQEDKLHKVLAENKELKELSQATTDQAKTIDVTANNTPEKHNAHVNALQTEIDLLKNHLDAEIKERAFIEHERDSFEIKYNALLMRIGNMEDNKDFDLTDTEIATLAGVPKGVTFDNSNLPHYYVNPTVEEHMTVYISTSGKKYHRKYGCCGARKKIHLFSIAGQYGPCQNCVPYEASNYTPPQWYFRYLQLWAKRYSAQQNYDATSNSRMRYQLEIPEEESLSSMGLPE